MKQIHQHKNGKHLWEILAVDMQDKEIDKLHAHSWLSVVIIIA